MLGLKKGTEYITVWKLKGLLKSRLNTLYSAFLPNRNILDTKSEYMLIAPL